MKFYTEEEYYESQNMEKSQDNGVEVGCGFCWDKRKNKSKELFFLDSANNMRICSYCPNCGRPYDELEGL